MIYQHVYPPPALAEFVEKYLLIHFEMNSNQSAVFKPYPARPEYCMTFTPEGFDLREDAQTGQKYRVAPNAIFGPPVSRFNFHPSPQYRMIRVFFQPGAVFRLFGVPLPELTNQCIDAESLVGSEAAQVNERLANAATYEQMIEIVNAYLFCKISRAKRAESSLDKVATYLWANPIRFSLDWLADQSCLSARQFNRRFTERMGIGPKLCSRIARYYRAYQFREANPKTDWLSVALWFGYTDVHHMAKDFKEFAGVTPNQLLNENRQSPELLLKLRQ